MVSVCLKAEGRKESSYVKTEIPLRVAIKVENSSN